MIESDNAWIAYQTLRENILSRKYRPGYQLKELPLVKELRLTRTPIREAINRLAHDGLVKRYPNKGAFVTALSKQEIEEIFEVREALEVKAVHLAMRRACRDDLDQIQNELEVNIQSLRRDNRKRHYLPKVDFHYEIIKLSRNKTLIGIWEGLQTNLYRMRIQSALLGGRYLKALEEHKEILACIYRDNPEDAERRILLHIERAKPDFSAVLK